MVAILSAVVSIFAFRFRSRASLEIELIAVRHQLTVLRRHRRGTVEVGNGFPRDGTDGEWKIAGRDAILTMKDGSMKLATADGDEILPSVTVTSPYFTAVRDALDRWQRGEEPRVSVHDCARVVRFDRPGVRARRVT
jgi:hypothetical protein